MLGYQAIPELLRQRGLTTVFAMIAETNGPWLGHGDAIGVIDMVRTRHEETAVMAAVGFARSTGKIGIASVTRGPGLANSINALAAAVDTHVPLILITAHGPRPSAQTQNIEQEGIVRLLGAGYLAVHTAAELPAALDRAIAAATWNGHPQVLALSDDVLDGEVDVTFDPGPGSREAPVVLGDSVEQVVAALSKSQRPLIIGGQGAVLSDAGGDLVRLADLVGAGLGTTLLSIRMFSGHDRDLGLVGGWAPRAARAYFQSVDLVLAFGATLNRFTMDKGTLFADATVMQCLIDEEGMGSFRKPDLSLVGDAQAVARAITDAWQERGLTPRPYAGPNFGDIQRSVLNADVAVSPERGMDVRQVVHAIGARLPADRIVVTDTGRAIVTLPDLVDARDARSWIHGRGYGSIGQGLGLAIGAAVAYPERQVVLFVGDGAFLSFCHDLDAVRLAGMRNLAIIVLNDARYGMEMGRMRRYGLPMSTIEQSTPDLIALARVYGGDGVQISNDWELEELRIPVGGGLFIVDVLIDPEADLTTAVGDGSGMK